MPLAFQALWEAEIRKNLVKKKKNCETPSQQKKSWVWWCVSVISVIAGKHKIGGWWFRPAWTKKQNPISNFFF
jgi:hypothetical protein